MSEELQYTEAVNETPVANPEADSMATKALVWGILGLAMSSWGVLGLIFSIIGKNCAKSYEELMGELNAKARVGKILGTIGFILGLIMTIVWGICLLVIFAAILSEL